MIKKKDLITCGCILYIEEHQEKKELQRRGWENNGKTEIQWVENKGDKNKRELEKEPGRRLQATEEEREAKE